MTTDHPAEAAAATPPRSRRAWALVRDVIVIVLIAVLVSFLVKTFLVRSFYIPSGSMQQTLQIDDRILVDELTPRFTGYDRGDVIVFSDPGGWLPVSPRQDRSPVAAAVDGVLSFVGLSASDSKDHLIKRIIGLPGDHVVCCNALDQITVNAVPIDETAYLNLAAGQTAPMRAEFDVVVPDGMVWVLGDNRDQSRDSRYNTDGPTQGFVPLDDVVGRAFLITWPLTRFGLIDGASSVYSGVPDAGDVEDVGEQR